MLVYVDKDYITKVKDTIKSYRNNLSTDDGLNWDALKCEIRGYTISYSTAKKKKVQKYEAELVERLAFLEHNLNDENKEEYATIKSQIEQIYNEHAMGIKLRSRARFLEESEQNLAYFSKEESKNYNVRYIRSLYVDNIITYDPKEILLEEENFYKKLYTQTHFEDIDMRLLENVNIPQLSAVDSNHCEKPITIQEIGKALKELPNKKTPGTDGFTTEFYKFFWIDIKDIVFNSLLYAFKTNRLSIEQKRGILALIPKKSKDLRRLKNWRPLTLLNTDYKILTKTLATRLQTVISKIIHIDQSAYIKGRFIGNNIRNIFDIIDFAKLLIGHLTSI